METNEGPSTCAVHNIHTSSYFVKATQSLFGIGNNLFILKFYKRRLYLRNTLRLTKKYGIKHVLSYTLLAKSHEFVCKFLTTPWEFRGDRCSKRGTSQKVSQYFSFLYIRLTSGVEKKKFCVFKAYWKLRKQERSARVVIFSAQFCLLIETWC